MTQNKKQGSNTTEPETEIHKQLVLDVSSITYSCYLHQTLLAVLYTALISMSIIVTNTHDEAVYSPH
jgi:hypothetical protein